MRQIIRSKLPQRLKISTSIRRFCSEELDHFFGRSTRFCVSAVQEALHKAGLNIENRDTGNIGISLGANEEYAHFSQYDRMFVPEKIYDLLRMRKLAQPLDNNPYPHLASTRHLGQIWPLRRSAHMAANLISILYNIQGPISTTSSACAS